MIRGSNSKRVTESFTVPEGKGECYSEGKRENVIV